MLLQIRIRIVKTVNNQNKLFICISNTLLFELKSYHETIKSLKTAKFIFL